MRWVTVQSEVLKDSESVIPINIPSSNYLLVGKVVAETREPEGSDRKILEEKQQRKVERKKPCFTLLSYTAPSPRMRMKNFVLLLPHPSMRVPASKTQGWHIHSVQCSVGPHHSFSR